MTLDDKLARRQWRRADGEEGRRYTGADRGPLAAGLAAAIGLESSDVYGNRDSGGRRPRGRSGAPRRGVPEYLFYPLPFLPSPDAAVILAIKEGLAIPAQDTTVFFDHQKRGWFQFYEGHNAAMPFWGFANGDGSGLMTLILTPNDAGFRLSRRSGLLTDQVVWHPEFGRFGYDRTLRYIPLERGGYVAMARTTAQAEEDGLIKTLREKVRENPKVERLLGAAEVWFCDHRHLVKDCATVAKRLQQLGVAHAIFNGGSPWWNQMSAQEAVAIERAGVFAQRVRQFPGCHGPRQLPASARPEPDLPATGKGLARGGSAHGQWLSAERLAGDRQRWQTYFCGRLSDQARMKYVKERVASELAATPYGAQFFDTEASTYWTEDYNPRFRAPAAKPAPPA